jgi:shikimate dehydrogenase
MAKTIYGIIGYPVKHSLSPAMQNAAFKALGIDAEYKLFEVAPADVGSFLDSASGKGISGFNVTVPHKIAAKEYIEKRGFLDETARKLGAVNTVNTAGGSLKGYNTDGPGFYRSLQEDLKFEPEGKNVFVLGSGGAARAVVMYLGNGPKKIYVFDVDAKKAEDLKTHYWKYYDADRLMTVSRSDMGLVLSQSHLLVNATPVGMKEGEAMPIDKESLHLGLRVYDLVYNRQTELIKEASKMKLHAVTGLGMLLYQGAIAFEIWTGRSAPVDVMRKALKSAIK